MDSAGKIKERRYLMEKLIQTYQCSQGKSLIYSNYPILDGNSTPCAKCSRKSECIKIVKEEDPKDVG
jgi:hypothetical protein